MGKSPLKMSPEAYQRMMEIVDAVLDHEQREWPALLVERCGHDVDLFFEACSLVSASRNAGSFIERPALDLFGYTHDPRGQQGTPPEE